MVPSWSKLLPKIVNRTKEFEYTHRWTLLEIETAVCFLLSYQERFPYPELTLTWQETHQVMNLLMDYRTDIIVLSVVEQREAEQKKREARSHKKPKMIQVDGQ